MDKYEIMFIVKTTLEESVVKSTVESLTSIITDMKGKVENSKDMGQRELAYEINKFKTGYYFFYEVGYRLGTDENGEYYMGKFDFSQIDTTQLSWSVETDNSTPWSEGIQMQTLEKLYARQILTDAYDYVRAIPQSRLKNKARILKKLRIKTEQN